MERGCLAPPRPCAPPAAHARLRLRSRSRGRLADDDEPRPLGLESRSLCLFMAPARLAGAGGPRSPSQRRRRRPRQRPGAAIADKGLGAATGEAGAALRAGGAALSGCAGRPRDPGWRGQRRACVIGLHAHYHVSPVANWRERPHCGLAPPCGWRGRGRGSTETELWKRPHRRGCSGLELYSISQSQD